MTDSRVPDKPTLDGLERREVFTAARAASEGSPAIAAVRAALAAAVPPGLA